MPLGDRKKRLARLLRGRRLGIVLSDHTDEDAERAGVRTGDGVSIAMAEPPRRFPPPWHTDPMPGGAAPDDPGIRPMSPQALSHLLDRGPHRLEVVILPINKWQKTATPSRRSALQSLVVDRSLPLVGRRARTVASRRLFREPIHDNGVGRGLRASSA
jgi:hypothetical protein